MKGGYNGERCPICQREYDEYVPKDSGAEIDGEVMRVCAVLEYGGFASGAYIHK